MKIKYAFLVSLFLLYPLISFSQSSAEEITVEDTLAVIKPQIIPLVDINDRVEETRQVIFDKSEELEIGSEIKLIDSLLVERNLFLVKEAAEFRDYNPYNLSKFFLENTYRAWEGYHQQLDEWKYEVNHSLSGAQDHINDLSFIKQEWKLTLEFSRESDESTELQDRISDIILVVDSLSQSFEEKIETLISLEADITDAMSFSNSILEDVGELQQHLRDSLLVAREVPLWAIDLSGDNVTQFDNRIHKFWHENTQVFRNYFKSLTLTFYLVILIVLFLLLYQLRRSYFKLGLNESDPGFVNVKRIMVSNYLPSAFAIAIFLYLIMFPYNPLAFSGLLSFLLLICMRFILADFMGPPGKRLIWLLALLMAFNQMEIIFWYFSDFARIYILFEASAVLAVTTLLILPATRRKFMKGQAFLKYAVRLGYLVFILAAIAFLANIFGYLDLAVLMLKVGIQSSVFIVTIYGLTKVVRAIIISAGAVVRGTGNAFLLKYIDKFESWALSLLNVLAVLYLLTMILSALEVNRSVINWIVELFAKKWIINTLTLSLGGLVSLIIILILTFSISKFIKVLIEEEIAPHTKLPKGIPFAISVTIRYFLMVLGFIIALSAAGIDLGSFGLIAGALGIGIGFGLQNIVSNFISGLILVYERPVQTGDTIEVENLMGEVKSIGIRSSSVKTYDGAEVVVPNSNLISNKLINWTLSDNRKRIEVKVGVAYGSDPNIVLELLRKVANGHENVLKDPEPLALFDAFGDSSLNFRLLFWVYFEKGFTTKSDIAIGIYNILNENNISIPFPQVDLNVKRDS